MNLDLLLWLMARVAGLTAYTALAISLLSGLSLRLGVLSWLAGNRALRSVHEYTAVLWIPLGLLHLLCLLLDQTARIRPLDLFVPFLVPYGRLPLSLGTISFLLVLVVAGTGWLKRWMPGGAWRWVHRLSYVAFGVLFFHALLAGTDFADPIISAGTWGAAALLALLSLARVIWRRLPA